MDINNVRLGQKVYIDDNKLQVYTIKDWCNMGEPTCVMCARGTKRRGIHINIGRLTLKQKKIIILCTN